MMEVHFNSIPVSNATGQILRLSPWDCGGDLNPGDSMVITCLSDGVISGPGQIYNWVNNRSFHPPRFATFSFCDDEMIILTIWNPGAEPDKHSGIPEEKLVARRQHDQPQPSDSRLNLGPQLAVQELEYNRAGFGDGYDALSFHFTGNTAIEKTKIIDSGGSKNTYLARVADSEETLAKEVSFSLEASANILGAEVSGAASLYSKVDMKSTSLSLVCKETVILATRELDKTGLKLLPELDALMAANPTDFYKQYGTHFISSATQGGELTIVLTKEFQSIGQKMEAAASASLKYGTVKVASEFKTAIESFSSSGEARINMVQSGWLGLLPSMNTEQIVKYVEKFPVEIMNSETVSTFKVEVTPFTSIASSAASKALRDLLAPVFKKTEEFIEVINQYNDLLGKIEYADSVGLGVPEDLHTWEAEIMANLRTLKSVWMQHRGELTLPSITTLYNEHSISPPEHYEALIKKILQQTPVVSGATVYLRYMNGKSVTKYEEWYCPRVAEKEYLPTVGRYTEDNRLRISVVGDPGAAIRSGQSVMIETLEELPAGNEKFKFLSAFTDHSLYYYYSDSNWSKNQQWRIEKEDGGIINYGDKVRLINLAWDQQMAEEAGFLTTVPNQTTVHWALDKV